MTEEQEKRWVREWIIEGISQFIVDAATNPNAFVTAVFATKKPGGGELPQPMTVFVHHITPEYFEAGMVKIIEETSAIASFVASVDGDKLSIAIEARSEPHGRMWTGNVGAHVGDLEEERTHLTFFVPKVLN
jgi:hypothetical protein